MAAQPPSSNTSTLAEDKVKYTESTYDGPKQETLHQNDHQKLSTEANLPPKSEALAEVDVEKNDAPPAAVIGGVNPADFPDGGLEAWLVGSLFQIIIQQNANFEICRCVSVHGAACFAVSGG